MDTQENTNLQSLNISPVEKAETQPTFLSKNKLYIVGGVVGIVVITIATGVILSMGSSSRLQGMLDKRLMEQSSQTSSLPESLNKTETFVEEAPLTLEVETSPASPKGPTIKAVK
jgi:hypothetical protein